MALTAPPLKAAPHILCDWLELKALASPEGFYRISQLKRLRDVNRETEQSDSEGVEVREEDTDYRGVSGADDDAFLDAIGEEFQEREHNLGASYPFAVHGNRLTIHQPSGIGGYMYLFCLLLTYSNGHELFDGSWLPSVTNRERDLFQAGSTVAAAAEVLGCAISFGWPRPNDNPPFLTRLRAVYKLFGEGVVVSKPRPGVSPCPKDEEIDVIGWRPRRDGPGTDYLLGQVASGDNWMAKSVRGPGIDNFHRNWFEPPPASAVHAKASIFIPHAIPPVTLDGTRRQRMEVLTVKFGMIFDRMSLPSKVEDGLRLSYQDKSLTIERTDELPEISNWVIRQLRSLHERVK